MGETNLHIVMLFNFVLLISSGLGKVEGNTSQNTTFTLDGNIPALIGDNTNFTSNETQRKKRAGTSSTVINCYNCNIYVQAPSSDNEDRIVGGQPASDGQFPYQVSLRRHNSHFCGGSILHTMKHILTAAHCATDISLNEVTVVAGTNSLNSGGFAMSVVRATIHPNYNPQNNVNDVAVLELKSSLPVNNKIQPITLSNYAVPSGTRVILSGWGLTSYPGNIPNNLQYIALTTISLRTCQESLPGYPVYNTNICTRSPVNEGACQGDSGGPLVDVRSGKPVQVGVVSWGIPCAKGRPDVYSSVTAFRTWIQQQTG